MNSQKQLLVSLNFGGKQFEVGELVMKARKIYFRYYPGFIDTGLQISPFKLPLSSEILTQDTTLFDGLFGVFYDSLPDGWGRLVLDRMLIEKGVSLGEITPLDRLSFVGRSGMGALTYQPSKDSQIDYEKQLELDDIAEETHHILEGASSDIIEELVQLGGSSGGARPKIFVGYHPLKDHLIYGKENLPDGYEHWIIKFPASNDPLDISAIEFAYHKMALDAGLEMTSCRLFEGASGNLYFGTKRFDRMKDERFHLHSACGLMHDNFRLSNLDYGHLMDAAFKLENHVSAYEKVLRLATFNVLAHNRDDHSKNISFLMNDQGQWKMAPSYDLTFSFSSHGFHSTTVAGEGKAPGIQHLIELANIFGVKNPKHTIEGVQEAVKNWKKYAIESGVGKVSIKSIGKVLQ